MNPCVVENLLWFHTIQIAAIRFFQIIFSAGQEQNRFQSTGSLYSLPAMPPLPNTIQFLLFRFAKYQKELEDSYNFLVNEYQTKLDDYQKNKATWTETIRGLKEQELQDLQDKINQFQSDSQDKFASKKQELYAPILKKADDAVKAVAKENGYSYVFDTSAGAVLYAWDSDDLMALVKKKLGLQ